MKITSHCLLGLSLLLVVFSSAQAASTQSVPEQKRRVGNWYYISGTDRLFGVPRFVGAVHDTRARTSLIFTCQARPGVRPNKNATPMMSMILSDPIGAPGDTTPIRMRLGDTPIVNTKWVTGADRESTLEESEQADPLKLLFRMAGNKHQRLEMELPTRRLHFDLDGSSTVLLQMLDTCVKPATGAKKKKPRKRKGK